MARPTRHNADYYTHDADLRNDRRVKAIRTKFGAAGYGLLHMVLEALTDADHTQLDTEPLEIELLAGDFGVSATEIHELLQFGESIGYFQRNGTGLLTCSELDKWLEPVFEKRNRTRNAAPAGLLPQPASETGVSVTVNPQSKVKKSREEKSKEEGGVAAPPPVLKNFPEQPAESPTPADVPPPPPPTPPPAPRPGRCLPPDEAPIFQRPEFTTHLTSAPMQEAFGKLDTAHYWLSIMRKAEKKEESRPGRQTNNDWKDFIFTFLTNDKKDGNLMPATAKKGERQPTDLLRPKDMPIYR